MSNKEPTWKKLRFESSSEYETYLFKCDHKKSLDHEIAKHVLAKDKGFKSLGEYQEHLAKENGFKSHAEYQEYLGLNPLQTCGHLMTLENGITKYLAKKK